MSDYMFWQPVEDAAEREALRSDLPGYYEGPADAYRHIVGVAELRRRFGFPTAFGIAAGNEVYGFHRRRLRRGPRDIDGPSREMDEHNNAIGLEIGASARTYEEVVRRARAAIDAGVTNGGSGSDNTPRWIAVGDWDEPELRPKANRTIPVTWPSDIPSLDGYRFGDERFGVDRAARAGTPRQREAALIDRLTDTPTREWSDDDVRAVIGSTAYLNRTAPGHERWRARVRAYFEERDQRAGGGPGTEGTGADDACGGVAAVRPHTRRGPSGPIQVSGHSRAVTCD
ncbi:hypothetical protein [Elioraea sp.]|uniref:hypothetical protein n=1 Tax=Elioraea sp. TaxID=2185103 RepID=UPI0025BBA0F4|nr:hypothetical protein [Elioraea sp.]